MNVRELRVILLNVTDDKMSVTVECDNYDYEINSVEFGVEANSDNSEDSLTDKVVRMVWE